MIRVLVVDDHTLVRHGIVQILADERDMVAAAQAGSASEALRRFREADYQVVLLDISLPDGNGLDVLKQLRLLKPGVVVLVLSMYPEAQYAVRALAAGAAGYLTKESAPEELVMAIRKVARGQRYVSASLAQELAARLAITAAVMQPHETLSDREDQVMRLLAAGKTISRIAAELSLSAKTISTYRNRILTKLELETTAEIVRYALERKLVL